MVRADILTVLAHSFFAQDFVVDGDEASVHVCDALWLVAKSDRALPPELALARHP